MVDPNLSYYGQVTSIEQRDGVLLTETQYPASANLAEHSHGSSHVAILLAGSYLERQGSKVNLVLAGDFIHYSRDMVHQDLFGQQMGHCLNLEYGEDATAIAALPHKVCTPNEVGKLISSLGRDSEVATESWLLRSRVLVESDPSLSLSPLAAQVAVHPSHLAKAFRKAYGWSVGQYITRCRVKRGAELLIGTEWPIAEIAIESGFFDQSHFTNVFHRIAGFCPLAVRRFAQS